MTSTRYKLRFTDKAAKDWRKLDPSLKDKFTRKLQERLSNPRVISAVLHGMRDCYKIKLRDDGYRLIYQVFDRTITVMIISIGRRDGSDAYREAERRLKELD
ncbi:type II toxin-antitoxin system RelE/ParE family toxin [uncultured Devosia sp.]|uniref:type II toxin-antitoxin system RelE family toxin n=1 Tax=uncultured Devosia sp. TaxID=211434 RepID=UPI0035CC5C3A